MLRIAVHKTSYAATVCTLLCLLTCRPSTLWATASPGSSIVEEAAYWERIGAWKELRLRADTNDRDRALVALAEYRKRLASSGIQVDSSIQKAATIRARQAAGGGDIKRGRLWLEIAEELDPGGPGVAAANMEVDIHEGFSGWFRAPIHMWRVVTKSLFHASSPMSLWAFVGMVGSFVLSIGVFLLLFAIMVRKLPYLQHRLDHWAIFPLPSVVFQFWALATLLLGLSFGLGLLPTALILVALLSVFHTDKNRVAQALCILCLCALPAMNHWHWTDQAYRSSGMMDVERCEQGDCRFFSDHELERPLEAESRYARGLMLARKADLIGAKIELVASKSEGIIDPGVDVALGNVLLLRLVSRCPVGHLTPDLARWVKDARAFYKEALKKDPSLGGAHYGMALSEKLLGNDFIASMHLADYQEHSNGGPESTGMGGLGICPDSGQSMLGQVVWARLSNAHRQDAAQRIMEARNYKTSVVFHEWFLGDIHSSELALSALIVALFILLLGSTTSRILGSRRCVRCSDLCCASCASSALHTKLCQNCLMDKLQVAIADPQDVWRRQAGHDRRALAFGRWVLVLGLILPGGGSVLSGRTFRGLTLVAMTALGVAFILGPLGFMPGWPAHYGAASSAAFAPALWMLIPAYIWGVFDAFAASKVTLK